MLHHVCGKNPLVFHRGEVWGGGGGSFHFNNKAKGLQAFMSSFKQGTYSYNICNSISGKHLVMIETVF